MWIQYYLITNCYYLADTEDENGGKTAEQFKSGEVAYLLNGSKSEGDTVHFYQNLSGENADALPVLDNTHGVVYTGEDCKTGGTSYTNNADSIAEGKIHDFDENGFCKKDSTHYQPATLDETTETTRSQCWSAVLVCGICEYQAVLLMTIRI